MSLSRAVYEDYAQIGKAYSSEGGENLDLSTVGFLQGIYVQHNSGTMTGGSSGDYIANTILQYLKLDINGTNVIDWSGDVVADKVPYGILAMREFNSQRRKIAEPAEEFFIPVGKNLPLDKNVTIRYKFNSIGNINDGDRTAYSGSIDIKLVVSKVPLGPKISVGTYYSKFTYGSATGTHKKFIQSSRSGYKTTLLLLYLEDNETASTTAIDAITIKIGSTILFDGSFSQLIARNQENSQLALNTGFAMLPLNTAVGNNQLEISVRIDSAGTDVELHYWTIQTSRIGIPKV